MYFNAKEAAYIAYNNKVMRLENEKAMYEAGYKQAKDADEKKMYSSLINNIENQIDNLYRLLMARHVA